MTENNSLRPASPPPGAMPIRVARLSRNAPTPFEITPGTDDCAILAEFLDILKLRKVRFDGQITSGPQGSWELRGHLGATVVQACSVTLAPVTTRLEEEVQRRYLPNMEDPAEGEAEMPEDADAEPLGEVIDPGAVMVEALALALPPFPRATDAELGEAVFAAPGTKAMRDEDTRPLAGLAQLRDRLRKDPGDAGD